MVKPKRQDNCRLRNLLEISWGSLAFVDLKLYLKLHLETSHRTIINLPLKNRSSYFNWIYQALLTMHAPPDH